MRKVEITKANILITLNAENYIFLLLFSFVTDDNWHLWQINNVQLILPGQL